MRGATTSVPWCSHAVLLQSGLEYAVLAGGDVGPLGTDAVTEIHKVFDWAETSKKG